MIGPLLTLFMSLIGPEHTEKSALSSYIKTSSEKTDLVCIIARRTKGFNPH
jgi:hypothetical protein